MGGHPGIEHFLSPAAGSFTQSCYGCAGNVNEKQGYMTCTCKDMKGANVSTSINNLSHCQNIKNGAPQVTNTNGQLTC